MPLSAAPRVLIVIPALNEAAHIKDVLNFALGFAERADGLVVVADGGSTDGTREIVRRRAADLRGATRARLRELGLTGASAVPADFTYYDQVLQVTTAFGALPPRFAHLRHGADSAQGESAYPGTSLDGFFTAARGEGELAALEMTKWLDSNYHYLVPELDETTLIDYVPGFGAVDPTDGPVAQVLEAQRAGEDVPRPVVVGPVTYLLLSKASDAAGEGFAVTDRLPDLLAAYGHLLADLWAAGAEWVQLDEPALVSDAWDLPRDGVLRLAVDVYTWVAAITERPQVLVAGTYGSLGDALPALAAAEDANPAAVKYLNRLSDWLFVAARHISREDGGTEVLWIKSE